MIRITLHEDATSLTMQLEGKLTGPLVQEAETCWEQSLAAAHKFNLRIDLTGATLIDTAGKAFLAAVRSQGAELVASGCLMQAIVDELTGGPISDCRSSSPSPPQPALIADRRHCGGEGRGEGAE